MAAIPERLDLANHRPALLQATAAALAACDTLLAAARNTLAAAQPTTDPDARQYAHHGLAWLATYVESLRQTHAWATRLRDSDTLTDTEALILLIGFGEYLAQIQGGIAMSQVEILRPADIGIPPDAVAAFTATPAVAALIAQGAADSARLRLTIQLSAANAAETGLFGNPALDDDSLHLMRDQFRRFATQRIAPHAQHWHLADRLIPLELIQEMADLGVFALTIPEQDGGLGLGKTALCVVSEELSRGYLGAGSIGTRAEIAAELIRAGGTPDQRARFLPGIASGAILPTAVFTEPNTGSDLARLQTRATRHGDSYRVHGAKTWITHAARADLMAILVRTDPASTDHNGVSMLLAEKPRGTETDPFPVAGLTGTEIPVLGYRGMKEYELAFDGFEIPAANLLGDREGQGFRQLMATFESARIQTAARAIGVAQNALETGWRYASDRRQFGKQLIQFPRVAGKLAWMAVETMMARQVTWFAAREKDLGRRCDVQAGFAKLLAARVAWSNADAALQIHGGNGYALEFPISRILCDARVLSIFEGAAEIQAQVIGRGLLAARN